MDLATLNVLLNSILVGIILITQFVNYPLLKKIDQNFEIIHKEYTKKMGYVVAPIMTLEAFAVFSMYIYYPKNNNLILIMCLTLIIWLSTFFIQVPIHKTISFKKNSKKVKKLITTNYIRTISWCFKLYLSMLLIS
ncbi:MAG: hypothetical protein CMP68_04925 [Flavobacteriales bacterium]|nr:hypothetical protein [Flavobacteriales bacterium]|tara:strand:+ start:8921 stop:9328 length:408 start_codon:yes stop_codon:yes gene_type:complete